MLSTRFNTPASALLSPYPAALVDALSASAAALVDAPSASADALVDAPSASAAALIDPLSAAAAATIALRVAVGPSALVSVAAARQGGVPPRLHARQAPLDGAVGIAPEVVLCAVHGALAPAGKRICVSPIFGTHALDKLVRPVAKQAIDRPLVSAVQTDIAVHLGDISVDVSIHLMSVATGAGRAVDVL